MSNGAMTADQLMGSQEGPKDPLTWGLPGHLTKEEKDVFFKFRDEVEKRGGEFRHTVYCFGEEEGEANAISRWLRARKFVYEDIVKMVEEATQVRKVAKTKDFYPNPVDALGCDSSLFFDQYPQLYSGHAKNGSPLFISKPGILNVDGMECITTLDGIIKFHWHIMMHDFANRLREQKAADPENFNRYVSIDYLFAKMLFLFSSRLRPLSFCFDSPCSVLYTSSLLLTALSVFAFWISTTLPRRS
jgi:hypothetical protein